MMSGPDERLKEGVHANDEGVACESHHSLLCLLIGPLSTGVLHSWNLHENSVVSKAHGMP